MQQAEHDRVELTVKLEDSLASNTAQELCDKLSSAFEQEGIQVANARASSGSTIIELVLIGLGSVTLVAALKGMGTELGKLVAKKLMPPYGNKKEASTRGELQPSSIDAPFDESLKPLVLDGIDVDPAIVTHAQIALRQTASLINEYSVQDSIMALRATSYDSVSKEERSLYLEYRVRKLT